MRPTLSFILPLALALGLGNLPATSAADLTDGQRAEASALFKEYTAQENDPEAQLETVDKMVELGPGVAAILFKQIDPNWERTHREYETAFSAATAEVARSRKSGDAKKEIEKYRATLLRIRQMGDKLTKETLHDEGGPALDALRDLAVLKKEDVFEAKPDLAELREKFLAITEARERTRSRSNLFSEKVFYEEHLEKFEEENVQALQSSDNRDDAAVLAENRKLASGVEPAEAEGIQDLNEMRILLGLRPLLLDPKLSEASRGHSKDMAENGFFAHDSPVKGKEDPWKRAKLAGTSASAENIFAGSEDPKAANRGWFFSPGHHVNMFGGHARVGVGVYGNHWTQMFGN